MKNMGPCRLAVKGVVHQLYHPLILDGQGQVTEQVAPLEIVGFLKLYDLIGGGLLFQCRGNIEDISDLFYRPGKLLTDLHVLELLQDAYGELHGFQLFFTEEKARWLVVGVIVIIPSVGV